MTGSTQTAAEGGSYFDLPSASVLLVLRGYRPRSYPSYFEDSLLAEGIPEIKGVPRAATEAF